MTPFPHSPKTQRPLWQTLLAPMLLASLGLHGLFLLIPVASSDEAAIPPPDPEQDNIAITRIPPAAPETEGSQPAPPGDSYPPGCTPTGTLNRGPTAPSGPNRDQSPTTAGQ